jgi:DNA modification methylase
LKPGDQKYEKLKRFIEGFGYVEPVNLVAYPILNYSMSNCIVLDPFGGNGSTLIACEQANRICHTIELDEKYCNVIVKRYIELKQSDTDVLLLKNGSKMKYSDLFE